MRRHGIDEVLLELPDGSKSLLPAAWTDLADGVGETGAAATVGSVADLLNTVALVAALLIPTSGHGAQAARLSPCEEDNRCSPPSSVCSRIGYRRHEGALD